MYDAATQISLTASGQSQVIESQVVLAAANVMATQHLPPILRRLREKAPGIKFELATSNDVSDLKKREADIAIRHARPDQPDLIAKLVGETTAHLYASTAYLGRVGRPRTVDDLEKPDFIGFEDRGLSLRLYNQIGINLTRANVMISSANGNTILALVRAGVGIGVFTGNDVAKTSDLEPIMLADFAVPVPIWLVTHRELHTSRRIRLV